LSSRLLSKNATVKICKTIVLLVVLYGCETWSRTLREEHRLRVFENRVLRRIFGPKRDEVRGEWRKLHNEELHILYSKYHQADQVNENGVGGDMRLAWERREKFTRFWLENPKERDHLEDRGVDGRMVSEWILGRLARGGGGVDSVD
jgi:hypothetical protein